MDAILNAPTTSRTNSNGTLIVISGGGFSQFENGLGIMKAMMEKGIPVGSLHTQYRGTSAGAIIACLMMSDASPDVIIDHIKTLDSSALVSKKWFWPFRMFWGDKCIYDRTGLEKLIDFYIGGSLFFNVDCIATKLLDDPGFLSFNNMERTVLPGSKNAALASSSIDRIFPRTTINGEQYIDGGYVDNVPLEPSDMQEYDDIYLVLLPQDLAYQDHMKTAIGKILQGLDLKISQEMNEAERIYSNKQKYPNVTVIRPPPQKTSLLSWSDNFSVLEEAYQHAKKILA